MFSLKSRFLLTQARKYRISEFQIIGTVEKALKDNFYTQVPFNTGFTV